MPSDARASSAARRRTGSASRLDARDRGSFVPPPPDELENARRLGAASPTSSWICHCSSRMLLLHAQFETITVPRRQRAGAAAARPGSSRSWRADRAAALPERRARTHCRPATALRRADGDVRMPWIELFLEAVRSWVHRRRASRREQIIEAARALHRAKATELAASTRRAGRRPDVREVVTTRTPSKVGSASPAPTALEAHRRQLQR